MVAETQAAMIAIAASGHALDGFYGKFRYVVPETTRRLWSRNKTARSSQIFETLKAGFGAKIENLQTDLKWLFGLRDAAVHFEEKAQAPVVHPTAGRTSADRVTYSLEPAERAVRFMLNVLDSCTRCPKAIAEDDAKSLRPFVEALLIEPR